MTSLFIPFFFFCFASFCVFLVIAMKGPKNSDKEIVDYVLARGSTLSDCLYMAESSKKWSLRRRYFMRSLHSVRQ